MSAHNTLGMGNIWLTGSPDQRKRYIPDLASGRKLAAWALTEPASGSDAAAMKTSAKKTAQGWVIDGTKNFCTNAPVASTFVIMAVTDPSLGNKGISAFIVERDNPGLKVGKIEDKLGVRASGTAQVLLTECEVPWDALLGEENRGFVNALRILDNGRIGIGAMAVGLAQGAFEEAVTYAKGRIQFDKPIAEHQAIQFQLAEMATKLQAARLLTYRAATMADAGQFTKEHVAYLSMAKYHATELAVRASGLAVQLLGAAGYMEDHPAEQWYRDAKQLTIVEGTSQVQLGLIARGVLDGDLWWD